MKNKFLWAALLVAACFSCASPIAKEYVVEGEVKGYGDGIFYVTTETLDDYTNDTAFVKNDRFTYRSSTDHPVRLLFLTHDNKPCEEKGTYSFLVFAENSHTPIQVKAEVEKRIENAVVTGSEVQKQFEEIEATGVLKRLKQAKWKKDSLLRAKDSVGFKIGSKEFDEVAKEGLEHLFALEFAPRSTAMVYTLYQYFPFLSVDELEQYLQRFDPELETSVYLEKMQERIRRERAMAVGQMAPEFTLEDVDGQKYHLSDFKGKMILLDFTASWCHWCKVEIPYIEAVYQEMQGKDFEVISVYLDKKREDWVKDVGKENHPWKCLSDVMSWSKGGMAYDYYVGGIPCLILLDRDGRIVSKDTRGEETIRVIRENYK